MTDDAFFPDKLRDQSEAALAGRKDKPNFVEYEFKVYKGSMLSPCLRDQFRC
jgi:carboxymethylenebutenolidase